MKKLVLLLSFFALVSCTTDSASSSKPSNPDAVATVDHSIQWGGIMKNDVPNPQNTGSGYGNVYIDSNGIVTGGFSYNLLGAFPTYGTMINGVFKSCPNPTTFNGPNPQNENGAYFMGTLTSPTQITGTYIDYGRNIHGTFIFNKY